MTPTSLSRAIARTNSGSVGTAWLITSALKRTSLRVDSRTDELTLPAIAAKTHASDQVHAPCTHLQCNYRDGFGNHVQAQVGDLWVRYAHLEAMLVSERRPRGAGQQRRHGLNVS